MGAAAAAGHIQIMRYLAFTQVSRADFPRPWPVRVGACCFIFSVRPLCEALVWVEQSDACFA